MKGMNFYLRFRRSYENYITENESLKKRLEDSDTNLARLQESHARREKEIPENNLAVQARIRDLECMLEVVCVISKSVLKDHSRIHTKFTSAKIEADRLSMRLLDATNEKAAFHNRTEILSQSILDIKMKFRRAKEKLHKYKEKAQSFFSAADLCFLGTRHRIFCGLHRRV
jgi:chromosome segregation ATPase